jgi:hypothetical protein
MAVPIPDDAPVTNTTLSSRDLPAIWVLPVPVVTGTRPQPKPNHSPVCYKEVAVIDSSSTEIGARRSHLDLWLDEAHRSRAVVENGAQSSGSSLFRARNDTNRQPYGRMET